MTDFYDNKDKLFKGQMADESYILFFRKHWLYILPTILIFFIVCAIAIGLTALMIFFGLKNVNISLLYLGASLLLAGFLAYLHWFFIKIFEHFLTICILTDRRLLVLRKSTYTTDLKETADLGMIQDVKKDQHGLIHNVLNYGNIIITFSSSSAIMVLQDVPNVEFHFRALMRARDALSVNRKNVAEKPDFVR